MSALLDDLPRESFRVRFTDLLIAQVNATHAACQGRTRAERAEAARRHINAFSIMQLIDRWRLRAASARASGQSEVAVAIDSYALHLRAGESVYDFEHVCEGDGATIQSCVDALVQCDADRFALFLLNGEGAEPSRHSPEYIRMHEP